MVSVGEASSSSLRKRWRAFICDRSLQRWCNSCTTMLSSLNRPIYSSSWIMVRISCRILWASSNFWFSISSILGIATWICTVSCVSSTVEYRSKTFLRVLSDLFKYFTASLVFSFDSGNFRPLRSHW